VNGSYQRICHYQKERRVESFLDFHQKLICKKERGEISCVALRNSCVVSQYLYFFASLFFDLPARAGWSGGETTKDVDKIERFCDNNNLFMAQSQRHFRSNIILFSTTFLLICYVRGGGTKLEDENKDEE
jgi:hypothetical protein